MQNIVTYVLGLQSGQFESGLARANGLTNNLTSSINGLGAAIGVTFGVAGIAMFTKSMIDAGSKIEDAQTGLTTLLRDSGAASQVIKNTLEDAQKTPFAFEGLLAANKALISADETATGARTAVLNLANAISATGGGDAELQRMVVNLQQVKNVGFASALDIKQFAYAGINIYKVLTEAGMQAGEGSKITYEQITTALQKAHDEGGIYFNGLENMANNTSVQISNLGDAFFQLKVKFFEDLKPMITDFVNGLKSTIEFVKENHREILNLGKALLVGAAAFKTVSILGAIIPPIITAMSTAALSGASAFEALGIAIGASLGPIGLAATAIGVLVGAYSLLNDAEEKRDALKERRAATNDALGSQEALRVDALIAEGKKAGISKDKIVNDEYNRVLKLKNDNLALLNNPKTNTIGFGESSFDIDNRIKKIEVKDAEYDAMLRAIPKENNIGTSKSAAVKALTNKSKTANTGAPKFDKAQGQKSITINVSIKDLIGTYNSTVTNVQGNATKIKEAVLGALTGAVNDFQIVAGQ